MGGVQRSARAVALAVAALAVGSTAQASASVIQVTTTQDVVDATDHQCSLREAVDAASQDGLSATDCTHGQQGTVDTIQLGAGHYVISIAPSGPDGNASRGAGRACGCAIRVGIGVRLLPRGR